MSDCLIFSGLFATFAVLGNATAGGPTVVVTAYLRNTNSDQ